MWSVLLTTTANWHFTIKSNKNLISDPSFQTDCLSVCVGLTNVFVLQFVVVVLLFFATREIDLATDLEEYYPGRYHGGT